MLVNTNMCQNDIDFQLLPDAVYQPQISINANSIWGGCVHEKDQNIKQKTFKKEKGLEDNYVYSLAMIDMKM